MMLDGEGRVPVMHLGMTGMIQVSPPFSLCLQSNVFLSQLKGQEPTWYRRRPREYARAWPPKVLSSLELTNSANNHFIPVLQIVSQ
jgi:formamidopyrimidine-DNA glycosylase